MDQPQLNEITPGDYVCTNCYADFDAETKVKRTLLGFFKQPCPECGSNVIYPLTAGYRVLYILLIAIFGAVSVAFIMKGDIPMPGLLFIAAIVGLIKDAEHRKKIALAWEENRAEKAMQQGEAGVVPPAGDIPPTPMS